MDLSERFRFNAHIKYALIVVPVYTRRSRRGVLRGANCFRIVINRNLFVYIVLHIIGLGTLRTYLYRCSWYHFIFAAFYFKIYDLHKCI